MLHAMTVTGFKCFKKSRFEFPRLTVLSGMNAAGKTSTLHALALLVQNTCEAEFSDNLCLNGATLQLGAAEDVLNRIHAKDNFSIELLIGNVKGSYVYTYDRQRNLQFAKSATDAQIYGVPCPNEDIFKEAVDGFFQSSTYLSADRLGPREMHSLDAVSGYHNNVGSRGERTIQVLRERGEQEILAGLQMPNCPPLLHRQVEAHMQQLFPGFRLDIQAVQRTNFATLGLSVYGGMDFVRPQNIGYGLSYTLPIIVACLNANANGIVMLENPEAHLHPQGQSQMGEFLGKAAAAGVQIIVETHSDHLLNGIRKSVKKHIVAADDVAIYFFKDISTKGEPNIERLHMDSAGSIAHWPKGFFDQYDTDINDLINWEG